MTPYRVSLAWNPSTDNSGSVSYQICSANVSSETWLYWQASSDNVDPRSVIRYDVYVNGVFDHSLLGHTQTVVYGNANAQNNFQVIAVDSAGNPSAPPSLTTCAVVFC